ncbi:MAG: DNA repair protein RecN [Bacteroidales bacterium]
MLTHLSIKNYALIEQLQVDFYEGFSVITGETGAGKSIIMGALSLILGQRADLQVLKNNTEKCFVEGIFDITRLDNKQLFAEQNLDYEPQSTILRREILPSGKSRAFINDTPVTLNVLKDLAEKMVDIHSQNTTGILQDHDFQLTVLDSFTGNQQELAAYRKLYAEYRKLKSQLQHLGEEEEKARTEQDFFRFQYDELEAAQLKAGEQAEIEEELEMLTHAGEIKTRLQNAVRLMNNEPGLMSMLSELKTELKPLKSISAELAALFQRVESNYLELQDMGREMERLEDKVTVDPERAGQLSERINLIYHLEQKHRVNSVEELIDVKVDYARKIDDFSSLADRIAQTQKELQATEVELQKLALALTKSRKQAIPEMQKQVLAIVQSLGMPDARFEIILGRTEEKNRNGQDQVMLMFNANKGGTPMEIARVASGGELSRLMLAVKSLIASRKIISTIIFDEIDSGVSGEVAGKMGSIMKQMSAGMQVISITHLPQIAARGNHHYLVYKENLPDSTRTMVKELPANERIDEIAKMLSDSRISSSALETARELLQN